MEFARTLLAFLSMAAASASLSAGSLVKNGDFSALDANGFPSSWSFAANRDAKVSASLLKGGGEDGSNAVKIVNRSPREPHVYGTLSQKVFVPKGSKCEVSFSLKGKNAAGVSFTYGKKWDGRFQCKEISSDWREFSYSFAPPDEDFDADGGLAIRFIFEDLAEELLLSSVKLEALNTLSSVKSPSELYVLRESPGFNPEDFSMPSALRTLRFPLSAAQCFRADGMPSAADLSCEAAAEYDAEGLIFHIKVRDDKLAPSPGEMLWQGDSIQLRIDQHGSLGPEDPSDVEIGVGLFSGKPQSWSWTLGRELNANELDCAIAQTDDGYFANLRLKWELLKDFDPAKGAFSFNMVVNDNDGSGRKAIFLAQGIHISKSSKSNCLGLLEGKAQAFINAPAGDKLMDFDGKLLFLAPNAAKSPLSLQVSDKAGRTASQAIASAKSLFDEELASAKLSLDLAKLAAGPLDAKLVSGSSVLWSAKLLKSDIVKDAQQALSSASERYAALCKEFDSKKLKSWRADAIRAIFERQAPLLAKELETDSEPEEIAYYAKRGMRICGELGYLCDELKAELDKAAAGQAQLPVYKFLSTERRLSGGFFEAMMAGPDGKAVSRPVVFTGYGHFGQAQRDLPYFPSLQANSIQMEFGPSRMVNGEKPDGSFIIDLKYVQSLMDKALSSASENGSTICVLLSPHYFPGWALKAHPEVAEESGFLKYKFAHPYAKRLIEAYLRTAIPFLKSSKWASSIHSLCLTNEPTFPAKISDPFNRDLFKAWLQAKHGSVAGLNAAYGYSFKDFDSALPAGRELSIDDGGIYYDFNRWKMESFAAWHEWMASIVKELWPGMPVHSKIMMGGAFSNSAFVKEGIDPELFSKFCDLNGNDDYFIVDRPSTGAWQVTAMGYALQASLRPVHIVNSENHIISDRFDGDMPYGRIYSSLFQQFLKGCAGSMIWVWEDSSYKDTLKKGDFVGSIYRRPAAILAAADAGADANRIAPEIKEIFNAKPQAAILYSQASNIMDPVYGKRVADIFGALAFNGRKTAFISERQAQAGSFGGLKAIFIANASHVEPATLKALEAFQGSGGKLFSIGDSLSKDVYGKPLKSQLKTQALDKSLRGADLANLVGSVSDEALGKLPVRISSSSKSGLLHVDWQAVKSADGSWLLCAVNYNSEPLDVALEAPEGAKALDIVRLKETGRAIVLEPWRPLVLRVK